MKPLIQIIPDQNSYKVGIDETLGLRQVMLDLMQPIQSAIKENVYWNDVDLDTVVYKQRDGFIPHSHNCGGIQISVVVPKCEESSFHFITFGECDDAECDHDQSCAYEDDGHLDAMLRVWFKFEGYDQSTGELSFYITCNGGNGDAPYFRTKASEDYFEASFTCKSVAGVKRAAAKHIKALLAIVGGAS